MIGWHHWLTVHHFVQAPGVGDEQEILASCSPWGHKQLDKTEQQNWTDTYITPCTPQSHTSRSSQSARLGSLCYMVTSHQLSILHMVVYIYVYVYIHYQCIYTLSMYISYQSIIYLSIYLSIYIILSPLIPLFPSPTVYPSPFSTSVSPFLPYK